MMIEASRIACRRRPSRGQSGAAMATLALLAAVGAATAGAAAATSGVPEPVRYGFYRAMQAGGAGGTRRVYGGRGAAWGAGAGVALLDRYWATRCSAAALAPCWALTAAHCIAPRLAYVLYGEGTAAPVHRLYKHPGFRAVERDKDVTLLHHDVGLVRTRVDMLLARPPPPLRALARYDAADLAARGEDVQVFGFGRTERSAAGDRPYAVQLRLVECERATWQHCVCGTGIDGEAATAAEGGVCAGDSGGPVLYRGVQVGVTSMGPLECAAGGAGRAARGTSVVTALARYAELINATVRDADAALRMEQVSRAAPPRRRRAASAAAALAPPLLLCALRRLTSE